MADPGTPEAIAKGCKCSHNQPAPSNQWLITFGCPLHDNLPDNVREEIMVTRKAQADNSGVTDDDGICD